MFDIMDMEDDKRNNLLQLTDSQMKVNAWVYSLCVCSWKVAWPYLPDPKITENNFLPKIRVKDIVVAGLFGTPNFRNL